MKENQRQNELFITIMAYPNLSEGELADRVGLKRTPYTRKLLFALVEEGSVLRLWNENREPAAWVYCVQQTEELPL